MSKKKLTPKELGEKRKEAALKRIENTTNIEAPPIQIAPKREMTSEEFLVKRTEIAIKLITDSLETPNARQLEKIVLEMSSIGLPKVTNFTNNFILKYPDPVFQNQIFDIVLRKIDVSSSTNELNILKSEILLFKAKAIMAINLTEERTQIKLENATEALKLLEKANAIQNNELSTLIEETTKELITHHPTPIESFELAKYSVEFRTTHLELDPNHPTILEAYITAAQVGHIIDERAIKIEAMKNADAAYNMALHLGNKTYAAVALKFLASIYKDFGDLQKTSLLLEQSLSLEDVIIKNIEEPKDQELEPVKSLRSFEIIRKHGISDDLTLTIKQIIQESVLNPVYAAATLGKWTNKQFSIEYGVSGYLDNQFLSKALGSPLNNGIRLIDVIH